MWPNPQETADLVALTEEILNGKLNGKHFLYSDPSETKPKKIFSQYFISQTTKESCKVRKIILLDKGYLQFCVQTEAVSFSHDIEYILLSHNIPSTSYTSFCNIHNSALDYIYIS